MKLSITTFPWGRLNAPRQLSKILSEIKQIGFEGVGLEYGLLPQVLKKNPGQVPSLVNGVSSGEWWNLLPGSTN